MYKKLYITIIFINSLLLYLFPRQYHPTMPFHGACGILPSHFSILKLSPSSSAQKNDAIWAWSWTNSLKASFPGPSQQDGWSVLRILCIHDKKNAFYELIYDGWLSHIAKVAFFGLSQQDNMWEPILKTSAFLFFKNLYEVLFLNICSGC